MISVVEQFTICCERFQGALKNRGSHIADSTLANVLKAHGIEPAPDQGGVVLGKSDKTASRPIDAACTPEDIHATIFHAIGIRLSLYSPSILARSDADGRPLVRCERTPLPIWG